MWAWICDISFYECPISVLGNGVYDAEPWTNVSSLTSFSTTDPSMNPLPLSQNVSRWVNLVSISMIVNNAYSMPSLANLSNLTSITLLFMNSTLTSLPSNMFQGLNQVTSLSVGTGPRGITVLPSIGDMVRLVYLFVSNNNFTTLPDTFHNLTSLANAQVGGNVNLVKLPPSMQYCTSLAALSVTSTKLIFQDSWFDMRLTRIADISLDCLNLMTVLPTGFCQLSLRPVGGQNITILLHNTGSTIIPPCFSQNPYVGKLSIIGCTSMTSFPSVFDLPAIQSIYITNCPIYAPFPTTIPTIPTLIFARFINDSIPGPFPTSLAQNNPQLFELALDQNSLAGSIPDDAFANNTLLWYLAISNNMLTGAFPSSLCSGGSRRALAQIYAGMNRFTSLPSSFADCTGLGSFEFNDNWLAEFPNDTAFYALPSLGFLNIGGNYNLKGDLPRFWANHRSLQIVNMSSCSFHGNVPAINSSSLLYVFLSDNRLNGSIEDPIRGPSLYQLKLDRNVLSGPINDSAIWTVPSALQLLDISFNEFSGILPPSLFSTLPSLHFFYFNNNGFSGGLPALTTPNTMKIHGQNNFLDLCVSNPNLPTTPGTYEYWFYNELYSYGSCFCPSWYTTAITNSTCPPPGFIQVAVAIPPPPTPIMAPPPTLPIDPSAPSYSTVLPTPVCDCCKDDACPDDACPDDACQDAASSASNLANPLLVVFLSAVVAHWMTRA